MGDHAVRTAKEAMHNVTEHAKDTVRDATIGRAEHAVSNAGDTAKSFSASMTETVRQNPIPALIAGASIGWLLVFTDPDGLEIHVYTDESHGVDHGDRPGYGRRVGMAG